MTRIHSSDATVERSEQQNIENQFHSTRLLSSLLKSLTATILLTLTVGCIPTQKFQSKISSTSEKNLISVNNCDFISVKENNSQISLVSQNSNATQCASVDPFSQAVRFATKASQLAQTARTKQQWDKVAQEWVQAVAWMQAVPPGNPRRAFAEKKVAEYMRNLAYSQQQAASARSQYNPVSFNSDVLDTQLELYMSFVATVGPPDVLIVGSSRALYGVDPQQLQQYLVAKGYRPLNIFNFSINGATAKVVDFQLRQLLSNNQLPKLIIWADGVRAFNSGRVDRTYNSIVASEGKRKLLSGVRPQLPKGQSNFASTCYQFPKPYNVFAPPYSPFEISRGEAMEINYREQTTAVRPRVSDRPKRSEPGEETLLWERAATEGTRSNIGNTGVGNSSNNLYPDYFKTTQYSYQPLSQNSSNLTSHPRYSTQPLQTVAIADVANAIDANGFLPMDGRFNPSYYYQRRPYVAGLYDGDYAGFYLGGTQATALTSVVNFTKSRNIPLVFVNLPLSDSYLDSVRWSAEEDFHRWMLSRARENGFRFLNFNLYQPQLAKNEYFFDPSHLNRYGAAAVARYIAASSGISWPR
ncbi:hypothetical protein [Okeania sp. SIO1I7]|uniref:hypothetical protein n=1 Tax=Okeania sp. SIO1I7 TaxID=2607772 RepID=UPI0025D5B1BF|nr:hypothetical protein [Okeania sp. SIO1I7]